MIGARELAACRRGAVLINVSRGGLVDSAALRASLEDGRLAGAALDVAETEPLPTDDPLWGAPNLIITPHIAGSFKLWSRLSNLFAENARLFQAGQPLKYQVYIPAL
jgi:phosphoglycerate dehydrogenase-like enzyme